MVREAGQRVISAELQAAPAGRALEFRLRAIDGRLGIFLMKHLAVPRF